MEKFHSRNEKDLMESLKIKKNNRYSSDEEEVLAFGDDTDASDDDSEFNIEDDDEDEAGEEEEDKNVNEKEFDEYEMSTSWGKKKSAYFGGNKLANENDALLEEEEAKVLQSKMMKQLDMSDFGLDSFKSKTTEVKKLKTSEELESRKIAAKAFNEIQQGALSSDDRLQKIAKDLSKLSKKDKLEMLKQESPELFELVRDFQEKIDELQETLLPIFEAIKAGMIPPSLATEFIVNKTKLFLTYCSYLSFYFVLKSQRMPIDNHPIVKNILQFRNVSCFYLF